MAGDGRGVDEVDASARRLIEDLLNAFCARLDDREFSLVSALFTPDGIYATEAFEMKGRDAIHEMFSSGGWDPALRTNHSWMNLRATPKGDNRYEALINMIVVAGTAPFPSQGARLTSGKGANIIVVEDGVALFERWRLTRLHDGLLSSPAG